VKGIEITMAELEYSKYGKNAIELQLLMNGLLCVGNSKYFSSFGDLGCTWGDVMEFVNKREIFYSKFFKGQAIYLSPILYYSLKQCVKRPELGEAKVIYDFFYKNPCEAREAKVVLGLPEKKFNSLLEFLLRNFYITVYASGRILTSNWTTLIYCTDKTWELATPNKIDFTAESAFEIIQDFLQRSLSEKEILKLYKSFAIEHDGR